MSKRKLRIGFVGVGGMGQCAHLKNYAVIPDCEVAAVAEVKKEQARLVAARYGVPKVYHGFEEMLARESLDALVASQPFTRHGALVPELLKCGLPVFTEKPIAGSVEMGERIVEAEKNSKGWLMVGYHKRSDPATMAVKEAAERLRKSGELGSMTYVRVTMPAGDWVAHGFDGFIDVKEVISQPPSDPPPSGMDAETAKQYVSFVNYYIHQVNYVRHFAGDWDVNYAEKSGRLLAGESREGVPCVIEMSPYRTTLDWQETALICFERGWIKVELPAPLACNLAGRVEMFRDPENGTSPSFMSPVMPAVHAMRRQAENFLAAVRGEVPPMCSAVDALKDIKLARDYIRLLTGK